MILTLNTAKTFWYVVKNLWRLRVLFEHAIWIRYTINRLGDLIFQYSTSWTIELSIKHFLFRILLFIIKHIAMLEFVLRIGLMLHYFDLTPYNRCVFSSIQSHPSCPFTVRTIEIHYFVGNTNAMFFDSSSFYVHVWYVRVCGCVCAQAEWLTLTQILWVPVLIWVLNIQSAEIVILFAVEIT